MSSSRDFFEILGIFSLSLLLFTWGVGSEEVVGFESRFYLFALEMWRDGVHAFPTTYHQLYPDYPATSTFLIYLTAKFMGHMNKLAAVLPSAIAASLTLTMTYLIGSLHNKRWGLYGVLFLLMTIVFLKSARSIALDMYPAMITACCFYMVYSADIKDWRSRESMIYLLLILGFAFRGPIGLVIPTGVICTYYLQDANYKRFFIVGAFALLILITCTLTLLMLAHVDGGHEFVHDVLRMEIVGRMDKSHLPFYFYFTTGFKDYALSFPLAVIVLLGVIYYEQRLHHHTPELKLMVKLFGWAMIVMLGMSIPGDKKIRYILPIAPAIALFAAYVFIAPKGERYFLWLRWLLVRFFLVFPALLYIGLRVVMAYASKHSLDFQINYLLVTQVLFASIAGSFLLFVIFAKKEQWRDTGVLCIATLCFVFCYIVVAEPIELYIDKTRAFVLEVEKARKHNHAKLIFYRETPDGLPIKYLVDMPSEETPIFMGDEEELVSYASPAFFITSESYFNELSPVTAGQLHVVARDKIGHVPVVVFTNR